MLILGTAISCSTRNPLNYSVAIDKCSPDFYSQKTITYVLSSYDKHFTIPSSDFQKIIRKKNHGNKIIYEIAVSSSRSSYSKPQYKKFKSTRFITLNDKKIKRIALNIMKKHSNNIDRIKEAERFVYKHITNKTSGISLIPADMVFKGRTGDCTEHAVLVITLLHLMKIQSKAVVGLILNKKPKDRCGSLIFHMWAMAWDGKKWIYVDAAVPNLAAHPSLYITLSFHSLKTEMPLSYLKTISSIKDLRVFIK